MTDKHEWYIIEIKAINENCVVIDDCGYGLDNAEVNPKAFGQIPINVGDQFAFVGWTSSESYNEDYWIDSFVKIVKLS